MNHTTDLGAIRAEFEKLQAKLERGEDAYYTNEECADFVAEKVPALLELIAQLQEARRWRRVEEELPLKERSFSANSVIVLVKIYSGLFTAAWYNYDTDEWHSLRDGLVQVLEWRYAEPVPPEPEPPTTAPEPAPGERA